jgi:hypothetical protein
MGSILHAIQPGGAVQPNNNNNNNNEWDPDDLWNLLPFEMKCHVISMLDPATVASLVQVDPTVSEEAYREFIYPTAVELTAINEQLADLVTRASSDFGAHFKITEAAHRFREVMRWLNPDLWKAAWEETLGPIWVRFTELIADARQAGVDVDYRVDDYNSDGQFSL